jgi:hypothetical protein
MLLRLPVGRLSFVLCLVCGILAAPRESWPAQDPVNPPPVAAAPHQLIAALETQVDLLAANQQLKKGQHRTLRAALDRVHRALRNGKAETAIKRLETFTDLATALVASGAIDDKSGKNILETAAAATAGITAVLKLPDVQPPPQPCVAKTPCTFLVLRVDASARAGGDGSSARPYRRINDALARADRDKACGVELAIAAGRYTETIVLTRATRIVGAGATTTSIAGSILDRDGFDLSVSALHLHRSPDPGAIVVDGACPSSTKIGDVTISSATRNGIFQRGGSFRASNVTVSNTHALADERHAGAGIRLVDGVQGVLGQMSLHDNGSGGLSVEGFGTRVYISQSRATDNNANLFFMSVADEVRGLGAAIEAERGALLLAEFTNIKNNNFVGLLVSDGARAHYRYGTIGGTTIARAGFDILGGFNASISVASAEFDDISLEEAEFIGLGLRDSAATSSGGIVTPSPIGMSLNAGPGYTGAQLLQCLVHPMEFIGFDPDRDEFPLVMSPAVLPCLEDCPVLPCLSIPFDCTWCAR